MPAAAKEEMLASPNAEGIFSLAAGVAAALDTRDGANADRGEKSHQGIFSKNRRPRIGSTWLKWSGTHQDRSLAWSETMLGPTIYLYSGPNLIEETDQNGNILGRYVQSGGIDQPLAEIRSGTIGFYEHEGIGSITSLTSSTGAVSTSYSYDAFGNSAGSSGSFTNPIRYTGRELDAETGLYFYRARYYDASLGRFISEDSFRFTAGPNFYSYVGNEPVRHWDPSGHQQQGISCGVPPIYQPDQWNQPGYVNQNNCYSYSGDVLHGPGPDDYLPQPGEEVGRIPGLGCLEIKAGARAGGGYINGQNGNCPCGYSRVRLYWTDHFMFGSYPDYHWYRQDSNAQWSSKHGLQPVGAQLPDINAVEADRLHYNYNVFCGTMCAPNK